MAIYVEANEVGRYEGGVVTMGSSMKNRPEWIIICGKLAVNYSPKNGHCVRQVPRHKDT